MNFSTFFRRVTVRTIILDRKHMRSLKLPHRCHDCAAAELLP